MAGITSAGIGSGLDVSALVAQLVAAERAPTENRLRRSQAGVQLQVSALGAYRAAMASLQSAVDALKSGGSINKLLATSTDTDVFNATAGTGAVAGSYDIEVVSLAKPHKLVSSAYANSAASVGTGPVIITVGGETFQVQLGAGADSLAQLRDAINQASDNKGVTATLVNESGGTRLLLTAKDPGTSNALSVSGLTMTASQLATDAHIRVEGFNYYSGASNSITGAIDGVTIDLKSAAPGTTLQLKVAVDGNAASGAIGAFVSAYNKMVSTVAQLTKFDPTTKTGGPLMGDPAVRGMTSQVRNLVGGLVSGEGSYRMLSELGITTATDGTLSLDNAKLSAALAADQASAQNLFSGANGIATQLAASLKSFLGDTGQVKAETDGLQARLTDLAKQKVALDRRMIAVESRYRSQFTALDSLIGQLRTTSDFLTRQLSSLQEM